jgi:hypothetical protein
VAQTLEYSRQYQRRRRLDPEFRLKERIKTQIHRAKPEIHIKYVMYRTHQRSRKHGWAPIDPATLTPYPADGTCELCKKKSNSKRRLHADHDHTTGRFRGWICYPCNIAAGWVERVGLDAFAEWVKYENTFAKAA